MKLQPEVVARLADRIARLFGDLEDSMIMQIALSLVDGLPGSDDLTLKQINDWQIARLVAASQMRRQLIFKARQSLKPVPKALKGFFKEVEEEAKTLPDQAQKEAVGRWLGQEEVQPSLLLQKAMTEATDKLNLVATSMLTDAQQQHRDSLNRAADLMRQGQSPSVAIKEGVRDLVDKGLTGFYDKAGRKWEPQGGVNMMIRTTGNNMANEASFQAIEKTGTDVLLVSAHMGARPKCSLVQGKLFSLSGETTSIKDGNGQTLAVGDWNKTSYGEPDGILGINCRHHIVPFYEGKSINNEEEIDVSENARRYKLEQKQRRKERELRKTKRQRDVAKAIGDEKGYKEAQQKARRQSKDLREFIEDNGLRRSKVRERNSYVPEDNKKTPAGKLNRSEDTTGKIKGMAEDEGVKTEKVELPQAEDSSIDGDRYLDQNKQQVETDITPDSWYTITKEQFGKKAGKHCQEYGLDPSKEKDRDEFLSITRRIIDGCDSIREVVNWRGGYSNVKAYIRGEDVVLLDRDNMYITTMKGGINNERIKNAGH